MTVTTETPDVAGLARVLDALRDWQADDSPLQLHPGDVGWHWRFGVEATAAALRVWCRGGSVQAVALLDGLRVARVTTAPDARRDEELAARLVADLADPARGVLPDGEANVDAPVGSLVHDLFDARGWGTGEPWTPLRLDLRAPADAPAGASRAPGGGIPDLRVEVVGPERASDRVAVQRAAFERSTFTVDRWHAMVAGPAYADARCLVAYDDAGTAVAAITVWSAGPGRPGLIEPMGVHHGHRGRGYGTAITVAGAAALRELGSSSVVVATPSSLTGAVATYRAAGMTPLPEIRDRCRTLPDPVPGGVHN